MSKVRELTELLSKNFVDEQRKGKNRALATKGKSSDILSQKIDDKEVLELYDILETCENDEMEIKDLIKKNIVFLIEREVGKGKVSSLSLDLEDSSEEGDKYFGIYAVSFKDGSDYEGNFIAEGTPIENEFELLEVSIGSGKLRYFGV